MPRWVAGGVEAAPTLAILSAASPPPLKYPGKDWEPGKEGRERWHAKEMAKVNASKKPMAVKVPRCPHESCDSDPRSL